MNQQMYNYNKGTVMMVEKAVKHALLRIYKPLVMEVFYYKAIDWRNLDSHGDRDTRR